MNVGFRIWAFHWTFRVLILNLNFKWLSWQCTWNTNYHWLACCARLPKWVWAQRIPWWCRWVGCTRRNGLSPWIHNGCRLSCEQVCKWKEHFYALIIFTYLHSSKWVGNHKNICSMLPAPRYANDAAFFGFELLNEPGASVVPLNVLEYYYTWGYETVRKYSATAYVIMCQRIGANFDELVNTLPADKVVLDIHCYNLFNSALFNQTTPQWNIDFVYNDRLSLVHSLNTAGNALIFVGN